MLRRTLLLAVTIACSCAVTDFAIAADAQAALKEGARLTANEVAALEAQLQADPLDMATRTRLLGYYGDIPRYREPASQARLRSLVLWHIHNDPKSAVFAALPAPAWQLDAHRDPDGYIEGKQAFLAHLELEPNDLSLLRLTADFLSLRDRSLATELLERAQAIDNANPEWALKLGFNHHLDSQGRSEEQNLKAARKAFDQYKRAFDLSEEEALVMGGNWAIAVALTVKEFDKARQWASAMLEDDRPGWNYGNNIHHGNIALGKIALAEGDVQGAASYLLLAGATPGSPQLNSFGPDFALAKQLLEAGEKEAVLQYLDQCTKFWKMGQDRLREWTTVVRAGSMPSSRDFGR